MPSIRKTKKALKKEIEILTLESKLYSILTKYDAIYEAIKRREKYLQQLKQLKRKKV